MNILIWKDTEQLGPYTETEIRERLIAGDFTQDDLAWTEGLVDWTPLSSLLPNIRSQQSDGAVYNYSKEDVVSGLLIVAKLAFSEVRRIIHLAGLKVKLIQFKCVILPSIHYTLGRKCYEDRCLESVLLAEYKNVDDLKQSVKNHRCEVAITDHASVFERLLAGAQRLIEIVKTEASALKFRRLFVKLGKAAGEEPAARLLQESNMIDQVKAQIKFIEAEIEAVSAIKILSGISAIKVLLFKQSLYIIESALDHLRKRKVAYVLVFSFVIMLIVNVERNRVSRVDNQASNISEKGSPKREIVQYTAADPTRKGEIHRIKIGTMYGYVSVDGNIIVQPQFLYAGEFSEGLAKVWRKDGWGFITDSGSFTDATPKDKRRSQETNLQLKAAQLVSRTSDASLARMIEMNMSMSLGSFGRLGTMSELEAKEVVLALIEAQCHRLQ